MCSSSGAIDRRVKCVVAQVPLISGHENARRLVRADLIAPTQEMFDGRPRGALSRRGADDDPGRRARGRAVRAADRRTPTSGSRRRGARARAVVDQRVHAAQRRDVLGVRAGHVPAVDLTDAAADGRRRRRPPDGLRPGDRRVRAGARAEAARDPAGGHFDAYIADFERSSGAARDWFVEHLLAGAREPALGLEPSAAVRRSARPADRGAPAAGRAAPRRPSGEEREDARARAAAR